jgi:hypothetical protein
MLCGSNLASYAHQRIKDFHIHVKSMVFKMRGKSQYLKITLSTVIAFSPTLKK